MSAIPLTKEQKEKERKEEREKEKRKRKEQERKEFSKEVNELARQIMIKLMTEETMMYDIPKIEYAIKHADYNLQSLIALIESTVRKPVDTYIVEDLTRCKTLNCKQP